MRNYIIALLVAGLVAASGLVGKSPKDLEGSFLDTNARLERQQQQSGI